MARYGVGSGGTALASRGAGAAFAALRAGANACTVYEVAIFAQSAAAATVALMRPANTPVGSTSVTPVAETTGTPLARLDTAWSTAPTVASSFLRQIGIPAAIGNGYTFVFPDGILVPANASLVLWSLVAASPTTMIHVVYDE